jgi:MerR family transcriptional regulator, mercuric resistance operon regulatory protein
MRTRDLAQQSGLNPETLRYYERRGLLALPPRTGGGYRNYPVSAVAVLRFIRRAQQLGFTLDDIKELLHLQPGGADSCTAARTLATARQADLAARIADLRRMHDCVTDLITTCDVSRADRTCQLLAALDTSPQCGGL